MITLITDRLICKISLLAKIEELIKENRIDQVILREKDLNEKELLLLYLKIKKLIENTHIQLIVNAPLTFAKKYDLKRIHLSQRNLKKIVIKEGVNNIYFGVSVHSKEEIKIALMYNPNYLLISPIFKTDCKKGQKPLGIKFLEEIKNMVDVPLIPLGGINDKRINQLKQIGITNVAMRSNLLL